MLRNKFNSVCCYIEGNRVYTNIHLGVISIMVSTINTSLRQVPAIFKKLEYQPYESILNFGCGRYPSEINNYFSKNNLSNTTTNGSTQSIFHFDPLFDNEKDILAQEVMTNFSQLQEYSYDTIICANVLNVLEDDILEEVISQLCYLLAQSKKLVVQIYEGNRSGEGKPTSKGYQRNEKVKAYESKFRQAISSSNNASTQAHFHFKGNTFTLTLT